MATDSTSIPLTGMARKQCVFHPGFLYKSSMGPNMCLSECCTEQTLTYIHTVLATESDSIYKYM